MVKEFKMSQERYDELKKELDYSKTTRADEIAELIKEARGFGDLSENSEYDEAKNEQGKLYSRIAELEEILLHAKIVGSRENIIAAGIKCCDKCGGYDFEVDGSKYGGWFRVCKKCGNRTPIGVCIGAQVTVTNLANGKELPAYKIVGSQEADVMNHAVSEDSPFGKALMGHAVGDEITVEAPRGAIRYHIDSIVLPYQH